MSNFHYKSSIYLSIFALLVLVFPLMLAYRQTQAQMTQGDQAVYLPVIMSREESTPPPTVTPSPTPTPTPSPTPPPTPVRKALFVEPDTRTANAAIAVDQQGNMHMVYSYFVPDSEHPMAVYRTCAVTADCATLTNWHGVLMLDYVNEVQLALTSEGQPRLLIRTNSTYTSIGDDYYFAACDVNCTYPDDWEIAYVVTTSGMASLTIEDVNRPQRSFALDPNGRPRFVYLDNTGPYHRGTYYAYCDAADCTNPNAWFETKISLSNDPFYEHYYYPSLTFTSQGQPRVVGDGLYLLQGQELGIYYLACDNYCDVGSNWQRVRLFDRGSGVNVSWDLEMHGSQPRLAIYEGAQLGGAGDTLYYAWCNTGCLTAANWQRHDLGLNSSDGRHPDLELDSQGRPRLAYALYHAGGLGYSWCNGSCESAGAAWQHQTVETRADLHTIWPVAYPPHCDGGLWDGLAPVLALDSAGNPRIAYDTAYHAQCWYDDPYDDDPNPVFRFHLIARSVRVTYFPQP